MPRNALGPSRTHLSVRENGRLTVLFCRATWEPGFPGSRGVA